MTGAALPFQSQQMENKEKDNVTHTFKENRPLRGV